MFIYRRENSDGTKTFYYSGAGEVVATVRPNVAGTFWIRDSYRSSISAYGQSVHATRTGAEEAAESGFDVIEK